LKEGFTPNAELIINYSLFIYTSAVFEFISTSSVCHFLLFPIYFKDIYQNGERKTVLLYYQ